MALVTVEGTYENGEIALAELPEGTGRARVMVTFLPGESVPATPTGLASTGDEARQRREAGRKLMAMMQRGINFGGGSFNREELYEECLDELDDRRSH